MHFFRISHLDVCHASTVMVSLCTTFERERRPGKVRYGRRRRARETDRARRPSIHQCRLLCALEAAEEIASQHDVVGPLAFTCAYADTLIAARNLL